jgi:hypothetical protein
MTSMRLQTIVVALLLCAVTGFGAAASTTRQTNPTGTFVGTTPATAELLQFLGAPPEANAALIEWSLSLTPSQYTLRAVYGLTQANFPGIQRERRQADRQGTWTAVKGTKWNAAADVIDLGGLAFVRVGPAILHALSADRSLMIGKGAASFSLNRSDAAEPAADPSLSTGGGEGSYTISPLSTGPTVYGVFEGRTPCHGLARALARAVDPGCARLKWRLTLYQDPESQRPTTFKLEGSMFRSDRLEGPWTISDRDVVRLEGPNRTALVSLLKVDDDAVMFLDRSGSLLVGNASFSYTLERRKRP